MEYKENKIICNCMQVSLFDIEDAVNNNKRFEGKKLKINDR